MKIDSKLVIPKFWLVTALILIFLLSGCSTQVSENIHLKFGNPSQANTSNQRNYLIEKPQYALAYNCSKGTPNWVSWQLNRNWLGKVERSNDFRPDASLPENCYAVRPNDYRGSGYDRGHLVPSGDRTRRKSDNSATFLMSNMIPQSPANNREVWRELEEYSRDLVDQGKELYIVAGGSGTAEKIANSKIIVPKYTWKVILVLERTSEEIDENTQTIAVWIPNSEKVNNTDWRDYIVSVDEVEKKTGYNFFAVLPKGIQKRIEKANYRN
ncbi:DNA/RNA non-specific endonuclease [Pleurocapsa sp. PCC 7319]|uniref:DNA/RNA non-specific endonuclease n=1 Tax=Pleurocapsa sp. PCC 7319 TaxID=118161 RepID=UPI00034C6646|nr:DNA/RNA non-specific endonuclease [Pleurocapsa sp. PCC 7319]